MLIYAGIDEAGYGPMFGPFVVARTVFAIEEAASDDPPPCLWTRMKEGVCKSGKDRRGRVVVNDSKKLYTPASGLGNLERGVLAFAHLAGHDPSTLEAMLSHVGLDDHSRVSQLLWYHDEAGGPLLPMHHTADQLAVTRGPLRRCADRAKVTVKELQSAVVYEDRFNKIIEATRSKGACAWQFVSQHLWEIWQRYGEHHPFVAVDRQGGRKVYHPHLQLIFEGAELRLLDESDDCSMYLIRKGDRAMTVSFETESEKRHLPTALASMTAKYLRETLMTRFNRFWRSHVPDVKPTAGYVQDGRRFLQEINDQIDRLGIDRKTLIRSR